MESNKSVVAKRKDYPRATFLDAENSLNNPFDIAQKFN